MGSLSRLLHGLSLHFRICFLSLHISCIRQSLYCANMLFQHFPLSSRAAERALLISILFTAFMQATSDLWPQYHGLDRNRQTGCLQSITSSNLLAIIPIFVEAIFPANAALHWGNMSCKLLSWDHFAEGIVLSFSSYKKMPLIRKNNRQMLAPILQQLNVIFSLSVSPVQTKIPHDVMKT